MDRDECDEQLVADVVETLADEVMPDGYTVTADDYEDILDPDTQTSLRVGAITDCPGDHPALNGYGTNVGYAALKDGVDPADLDHDPTVEYHVEEDVVLATITLDPDPWDSADMTVVLADGDNGGLTVQEQYPHRS